MTHYVSRGGFGDAWLAFLSVREKGNAVAWIHLTRRKEHVEPVAQLMKLMPDVLVAVELQDNGKAVSKRQNGLISMGGYASVSSKAASLRKPNPDLSFLAAARPMEDPYIVINPEAGKPANWRAIHPAVLSSLVEGTKCEGLGVGVSQTAVFLGKVPEHTRSNIPDAIDMCGKTSVQELINWIYHSEGFFAFDGAIAYMAMSMGKPGAILFTFDEKANGASKHYMNKRWKEQVKLGYSKKTLNKLGDVNWNS